MRQTGNKKFFRNNLILFAGIGMLALLLQSTVMRASETIDLRGYGKVTATITPDRSEFVCENEKKADWLLGKLLADMFWNADGKHTEKPVRISSNSNKEIPVHLFPPYGAVIAGRNGNRVILVGGESEQKAIAMAQKEKPLISDDAVFKPIAPYPKYLDSYDLGASVLGTPGLHHDNKYRWKERAEFVKKFYPGGYFWGLAAFRWTPADGVELSRLLADTDIKLAEEENLAYSMSISTGAWPDWARDKWPDYIDCGSPIHLLPFNPFLGCPPESFGMTSEERRQTSLKFLKDIILRYKDSPVLAVWELYCGDYICETHFMKSYQGHLGYSPVGLKGFRRWLKDVRGYSLTDLGKRWYGDRSHFKNWNEVMPADPDEFYGNLNRTCFRINNGWSWAKAKKGKSENPPDNPADWITVDVSPSEQQYALPREPAFWKVKFDAANWLNKNAGKDIYLICNINNLGWAPPTKVWLNGRNLGQFKPKVNTYFGPFGLKVTGLLNRGVNELCLQISGSRNLGGGIVGPVFLSTTRPKHYPYLGRHANARYVDALEWRLWELNFKVSDAMAYARSIDPDHPFVICATTGEVKDAQGADLMHYGGSMQDTGYESSYRPFNSRMGYAGGFYGTIEASNITFNPENVNKNTDTSIFDRMINWALFNGEGMYKELAKGVDIYKKLEDANGWFTRNTCKIRMIGKTLPVKPEIAILVSSLSALLSDEFHSFGEWNIGRGELAASHYDNVFVTETMLAEGVADDYPVLFDSDTMFMDGKIIDSIEKYVKKGGTFIALHNTGRHSILEADSWPISRLTGFKVLTVNKKGKIKFENKLPIFKGWEGKVFEGEGSALNWKDDQSARNTSIGMEPISPVLKDVIPLARWEDGSVAVGMRKLGKGRIIVFGSTFWRYGKDLGGTGIWRADKVEPVFFERLFTDLGVKRTADASTGEIFARKMITKNGLENWLVAMNQRGMGNKADTGFAFPEKPMEVTDKITGKTVPFEYKDGWVWIKKLNFGPWEAKIFGVKCKNLAGGVDFWWFEKEKFWKRRFEVKPYVETAAEDKSNPPAIQFEKWKFYADKDNSIARTNKWKQVSINDTQWRDANNLPWNFQYDDLKDYSGVGLYRSQPFAVPAGWKNKRLTLNINGYVRYMGACFTGFPDFYLNGERIVGLSKTVRQVDVTGKLKESGNVLAIRLTGRSPSGDYPLSGLMDTGIWLQPITELDNTISLAGEWQAVTGTKTQTVSLPGKVKGNHFIKEFDVPAAWKDRNVYLHLKNLQDIRPPFHGFSGYRSIVLVNGQARKPFDFIHQLYMPDDMLNITSYVKFGQKNRIELYPEPGSAPFSEYNFAIDKIAIGVEK